jgi:1-acyl-sn-glycerol-3-phosphate acyltransferase
VIPVSEIIVDKSMRLIARCLATNRLHTVASGLEHIPAEGPALIVARHYHHLYDGLALFAALPRRFHILVTLDWVKNKPTKLLMQSLNRLARWPTLLRADVVARHADGSNNLFSDRDVIRFQRRAILQSVELLAEGRLLVVFPEGFPNIDPVFTPKAAVDEFLPFKTGFLSIIAAAEKKIGVKVPLIPAGICYTTKKICIGHLAFGRAIDREQFPTREQLLDFLQAEVKKLSERNVTRRG